VLDIIAREPLWKHGLDYRHGTGHGVGYMLSVHEGPCSIHYANNAPALMPGMITSDEPGMYVDGKHGIRLENLLLCTEDTRNEYGQFLKFEPLTVAPIDLDAILPEVMDQSDIDLLNSYHSFVFESLSEHCDEDELVWLKYYTRSITKNN
jgi:Xaa-Pro aminopeptidase